MFVLFHSQVSILVVLDLALQRMIHHRYQTAYHLVSILVVLDLALQPELYHLLSERMIEVSILVVLDLALQPLTGAGPVWGHLWFQSLLYWI